MRLYWGLRDYGTATWDGGDAACDHAERSMKPSAKSTLEDHGPDGRSPQLDALPAIPFRHVCGKCGARRIDSQLGLERTPEEYVGKLVEVFREVRRMLRKDGTVWLNLGDSYTGGGGGNYGNGISNRIDGQHITNVRNKKGYSESIGLKPKDLVGIPWMVARALQSPYYVGKIKSETDRAWLAAMIDAEGCIAVNRLRAGNGMGENNRIKDSFGASVRVHNTSEAIVRRCAEIAGVGSVTMPDSRRRPVYMWGIYGDNARAIIREIYPHLVAKQHEARLAFASRELGQRSYEGLRLLHHGHSTTEDAAPPESLFEPGWFLRSDIIWAKPNPMPESVTDRPTKAHEYIFLLTRSPKYFFDQEAVREAIQTEKYPLAWSNQPGHSGHPGIRGEKGHPLPVNPAGRNVRSVWTIATQPFPEAHFATFPEELAERCIKAGTSEKGCCATCGTPWERVIENPPIPAAMRNRDGDTKMGFHTRQLGGGQAIQDWRMENPPRTTGWRPGCNCGGSDANSEANLAVVQDGMEQASVGRHGRGRADRLGPCTVLDPFCGSGTTGVVALALQRNFIGIELNSKYVEMARRRLDTVAPLFANLEARP